MTGFPPAPGEQVTLANWRTAPFNRWGFQHVRELLPSADIPNDRHHSWELPRALVDLPLGDLEATDTDGLVILHHGRIVFEYYAHGMTAASPHILMSVSKSLLAIIAGILEASGQLDLARPVTEVIPELKATAYRGATIRQLLDMRVGVEFNEDYLAMSGPIVAYRKATGWNPLGPGDKPSDLRSFLHELTGSDGPHGGRFHYVSPNTDLLGWVIERSGGVRYADLVSELLWRPMGAEYGAYITVDRLGAPRCAGGMCVTTRDLARVGQLIVDGGKCGGTPVIPPAWIEDLFEQGDPRAWDQGPFGQYYPGLPMHYRGKWYVRCGDRPLLFGMGVNGQNLFIDRAAGIVIAKFSSQAMPLDAPRMALTMTWVEHVRSLLGGA
ncbi:MAG: class C beta-lactamase-related serine hydrolase [Opitutus sp.]|nr:class C beta-lactamase-related serine hydrolase [Opitutus sp.]